MDEKIRKEVLKVLKEIITEILKEKLNEEQLQAVLYNDYHSLILAWAWSWKTRTLTYKLAYLIFGLNVNPNNILALTFTSKAADEMRKRILKIVLEIKERFKNKEKIYLDSEVWLYVNEILNLLEKKFSTTNNIYIWTFHSIFFRLIREHIHLLWKKYNSDVWICDSHESITIIRKLIKNRYKEIEEKINLFNRKLNEWKNIKQEIKNKLKSEIEILKEKLEFIENNIDEKFIYEEIRKNKTKWIIFEDYEDMFKKLIEKWDKLGYESVTEEDYYVYEIRKEYQEILEKTNKIDFDDILLYTYLIFNTYPEILYKYHKKFKYILIDEAQDTDWIQFQFLKMLVFWTPFLKSKYMLQQKKDVSYITFVWDDFQSIYWWRWALMNEFLDLPDFFKWIKIFKLTKNYRSLPYIVEAWNQIIKNNIHQYEKVIKPVRKWDWKIEIIIWENREKEAELVVKKIIELKEEEIINNFWDVAILYRSSFLSQAIEEKLVKNNIPYIIYWWLRFFERKEIKDMLAYLALIYNPNDFEALSRIINTPNRWIWDRTAEKLYFLIKEFNLNYKEVIENIEKYNIWIAKKNIKKLKDFLKLMNTIEWQLSKELSIWDLIRKIRELTEYDKFLEKKYDNEQVLEKKQNLDQLEKFSLKYRAEKDKIWELLNEIKMLLKEWSLQDDEEWKVKLMTIHKSKWLEFKVVFVVWLENDLFPNMIRIKISEDMFKEDELEEERRLMYVAITRAKDLIFFSFAKEDRNPKNWRKPIHKVPSMFLYEIDKSLYKEFDNIEDEQFFERYRERSKRWIYDWAIKYIRNEDLEEKRADEIINNFFGQENNDEDEISLI